MPITTDIRLIVKICKMCFEQDMSQKEVAHELRISRPQVSRAIAYAKKEGYISVDIRDPFSEENEIERKIKKKYGNYGLREVITIKTNKLSESKRLAEIGKCAARHIITRIRICDTVGVMCGWPVNGAVKGLPAFKKGEISVYPLVGGTGPFREDWHANNIAKELASKCGGKSYMLNVPLKMQSSVAKEIVCNEKMTKRVLDMAKKSKLMIVGIEDMTDNSEYLRHDVVTSAELSELRQAGVVCGISNVFLNREGSLVENEFTNSFVSVGYDDVKACSEVVAITYGADKADAIIAALKSGLVKTLITNYETAKKILK